MIASPNSIEVVHGSGENEEEPPPPPHSSIPPIDGDDDNNQEQDQSSQQNLSQPPAPTQNNTHVTDVNDEEESSIEPYREPYKRSGSTFSFLQAEPVDPLLLDEQRLEEETGRLPEIAVAGSLVSLVSEGDTNQEGFCGRHRRTICLVVTLLISITISSTVVVIVLFVKSRNNATKLSVQPSVQPSMAPSLILSTFDSCPSFMLLSEGDCKQEGLAVGGRLLNGEIQKVSMSSAPFGCSINKFDRSYILYNSLRGTNNGNFEPVCSKGSFTLLPESYKGGCLSPRNIDKEGCVAAGLSVGGTLKDDKLIEVSMDKLPFGCSIQSGGNIHYNSNMNGINDANYSSLCHELPFIKMDGLAQCPLESAVDKEECILAGLSVGATLLNNELIVDVWNDKPSGCFLEKGYKIMHFNTNPVGARGDNYVSVCQKIEAEDYIVLPPKLDSKCPLSIEVASDKCKVAGLAVGGVLRNDETVVERSWNHRPSGCFFGPEVYYNTNPNGVNGNDITTHIQVKSAGVFGGNDASIKVERKEYLQPAKRGFNVVVMNNDGSIISVKAFDTYLSQTNSNKFTKFLSELKNGVLVLISVKDEAQRNLTSDTKKALKDQLGSTMIDNLGFRHSWCIIGRKGTTTDISEDYQASSEASCNYQPGPWHPICNKMEGVVEVPPDKNKCTSGKQVMKKDCIAAGLTVGGKQIGGLLFEGSFDDRPSGCYIEEIGNDLIYFNTNTNPSENKANENVSLICQWECAQPNSKHHPGSFGCQCDQGYISQETGEKVLCCDSDTCINAPV